MERDIDNLIEYTLSTWDNSPKATVPEGFAARVAHRVRKEHAARQRRTYMVAAASLVLVGLNIAVMVNVMRPSTIDMTVQVHQEKSLLQQMQQEYFHNDSFGANR